MRVVLEPRLGLFGAAAAGYRRAMRDDPTVLEEDDALDGPIGPTHAHGFAVAERLDAVGSSEQIANFVFGHPLAQGAHHFVALLADHRRGVADDPLALGFLDGRLRSQKRPREIVDELRKGRLVAVVPVGHGRDEAQKEEVAGARAPHRALPRKRFRNA